MTGKFKITTLLDGSCSIEIVVEGKTAWKRVVPEPKPSGVGKLDLGAYFKARRDAASWARRNNVELI